MHNYFCFFAPNTKCALAVALPFSMAIKNEELMHEFIIIIVRILPPWTIFQRSTVNFCKPRGPQHTYYYIVVIIVAGKKMQEREMK